MNRPNLDIVFGENHMYVQKPKCKNVLLEGIFI